MKEKYLKAATRTVEAQSQEADKVFTLHPWIYPCFATFPFLFTAIRCVSFYNVSSYLGNQFLNI